MTNQRKFQAAPGPSRRSAAGSARRAIAAMLLMFAAPAFAQTPDDGPIRDLISRLDRGETEAVRQALPEAVTRYQNHPGILYLQARVATDGIEAAKLYQSVLDNYPASEWADDALYSLYQYYYAMGLYKTAELRMQQLRKEYPGSEHLAGKSTPPAPGPAGPGASTSTQQPPPAVTGETATKAPPPTTGRPASDLPASDLPASDRPATDRPATPPQESPAVDAGTPAPMPYTVQTGAFSTSENAQKQKSWFEDLGYTAEITSRVRGGKSLFLVWVGSYASADEARKVLLEIRSRYNITPIVVER